MKIQGTFWVCVDCMILAVNGETPSDPDPTQPEPWACWPDQHDVTPDFGGDDDEGINSFSWQYCMGCGSTLGGERYRFVWWV